MSVNTELAIGWFQARQGKVSYSMAHRNGSGSYDCSSAVYYALRTGGASAAKWAVSTETAHDWLIANGYKLISLNQDWDMERGDIVIWGVKGQSAGAGGHIMIALDANNVIHCTYAVNGITVNNYNQLYGWNAGTMGGPYVYVYRQGGGAGQAPTKSTTPPAAPASDSLESLAGQVMAGKYGAGEERKKALGGKYEAVQTIINERLKAITASQSHNRLADQVLAGRLGNGDERKRLLGSYYNAVQNIINNR